MNKTEKLNRIGSFINFQKRILDWNLSYSAIYFVQITIVTFKISQKGIWEVKKFPPNDRCLQTNWDVID